MNKFSDVADTSHQLSLAAMEEASRTGHRTADIEHLLLALTLTDQPGGQVLRSFGVTIETTRHAIAQQHAEQLASLGVTAHPSADGPIVFHETDGYEWSDRALAIIQRAAGRGRRGDAVAVLRELVAEPSGLIGDLLCRMNTPPEKLLERLDAADRIPAHPTTHRPRRPLSRRSEAFVPAPLNEVWALLSDPQRIPEWDQSIGSVEAELSEPPRDGDAWIAHAQTHYADGRPLRMAPELRRRLVQLDAIEPETRVAWRTTFPDRERANARVIDLTLAPAAHGTQVTISMAWDRHPARRPRPIVGWCMRPLTRLALWLQASQIGGGISRVFR